MPQIVVADYQIREVKPGVLGEARVDCIDIVGTIPGAVRVLIHIVSLCARVCAGSVEIIGNVLLQPENSVAVGIEPGGLVAAHIFPGGRAEWAAEWVDVGKGRAEVVGCRRVPVGCVMNSIVTRDN